MTPTTQKNNVSCETLRDLINHDLEPYSLSIDEQQSMILFNFWEILVSWNKSHNLTSVTDFAQACSVHFVDSLFPACTDSVFFEGAKILDVGTGGGFPGIPLSVYFKKCSFYLLDKNRKKISFIEYAAANLGLYNVTGLHENLEQHNSFDYDVIISRAVKVDEETFAACRKFLNKNGWMIFFYSSKQIPFQHKNLMFVKNFVSDQTVRSIAYYQF